MDEEKCDYVLLMHDEYRTYSSMDDLLADSTVEEIVANGWHVFALGDEVTVRTRTQWKAVGDTQWRAADE